MKNELNVRDDVSLLDAVHDNVTMVEAVTDGIYRLASAFRRTGNHDVADELFSYIEPLMTSAKQISASYSIELNDRVRQTQENSTNIIRGVLAGIEIGNKSDD